MMTVVDFVCVLLTLAVLIWFFLLIILILGYASKHKDTGQEDE